MAQTVVPITDEILTDFITLFRGRADVYGSWTGGCVRKALTPDTFRAHLQGDELIGVYTLLPYKSNWYCVWGCTDIDVDDIDSARNLQLALSIKGITSWVERTRKGYHVWVFADGLVPGAVMRRALLAAHQAINYPAKEVNPKQENAGAGYGNYVRLPYPRAVHGLFNAERVVLDDNDQPMPLETFLKEAVGSRATSAQLEAVARLWVPPSRTHVAQMETSVDVKQALHKVGAIPYVIWRDGPMEGNDRSSTLFRLAIKVKECNATPQEAYAIIKSADQRWGKFYLRPDGEQELIKIIERSYNIVFGDQNGN
jgi:hypothetical protein